MAKKPQIPTNDTKTHQINAGNVLGKTITPSYKVFYKEADNLIASKIHLGAA
jgi:hypothetical protein